MNKLYELISRLISRRRISSKINTLRYMFPMLFVALAALGASVITGVSGSYIKLVPSTQQLAAGESFSIDIYAVATVPVNALDISIRFDPEAITVTSVDQGQSVITLWTTEPKVQNDTIIMAGGTYRRGFIGEHFIATIEARTLKAGQTEFAIKGGTLLAGDGSGTPISLSRSKMDERQSVVIYNQGEDPGRIVAEVSVGINADIDGDGVVSLRDVSIFMSAWYSGQEQYDFNSDGRMNFIDFSIVLARSFFRSTN